MKLLAGLGETGGDVASLQSDLAALKVKLDDVNAQITFNSAQANAAPDKDTAQHYAGAAASQSAIASGITKEMSAVQAKIDAITGAAQAKTDAAAAKKAAYDSSPVGIAAANKIAADNFKQQAYFLTQPGYDYGKGSSRRNSFYKGLGDAMTPVKSSHSLFNLYNRDGLNDIFSDVLTGIKGGASAVKAAGQSPQFNLPSIPGLPSIAVPSWLSTFVQAGVKAGQDASKKKNAPAPAPDNNIGTGGAQRNYTPSTPNYLGWGVAALSVATASWVLLRRKR